MKKIFTLVATIAISLTTTAQTMNVHFKNGTKVQFDKSTVDYVDFTEKADDPSITEGEYVDLGLSVKWATCNLGASSATALGNEYAWGETSTKTYFSESNYAYYNSSTETYTDIGSDISGTQYDAATVNLGKDWRMPTKTEMNELYNECTWTWTQVNGVNGYKVTGTNGNSIFLPKSDTYTKFWTANNKSSSDNSQAVYVFFSSSSYVGMEAFWGSGSSRYYGYYIRPVYSPSSDSGISNITDYVTISRTGTSTVISSSGTAYTVTFSIKNTHSTETIHLVSLGGVNIDQDLAAGKTYTTTLQSSTTYIQNYKLDLVFTYNGKSYTIQG